jgi:hypothetical protein
MDGNNRPISKWSSVYVSLSKWKWVIYPLVTFALVEIPSASFQAGTEVKWSRGQLSVTAEKVPLSEILQAIVSQTGIEIVGLEELQEEVSVHLSDLTLREGLQRLLARVNYLLVERVTPKEGTRPILAVILGGRGTSSSQKVVNLVVGPGGDSRKGLSATEDTEQTLRKARSDPDPTSQATALDLIAERDVQNAVPALVEGTKSSVPEVRLRALDLLASSQADEQTIVSALGSAVSDEDAQVKRYAIRSLAQRRAPEGLGYLRAALSDPDPGIRMLAIDNIFRFVPTAKGIPLLQEAAGTDPNESVRSTASSLLEEALRRR